MVQQLAREPFTLEIRVRFPLALPMERQWPTLEGRLRNGFATELEALEQLASMNPLSEYGKKRLAKLRKKEAKRRTISGRGIVDS